MNQTYSPEHCNSENKESEKETEFDQYSQEKGTNEKLSPENVSENQFKDQIQIRNAYLVHSQYLSGITEKSEEESRMTNKMYQNSYYDKDKDNIDSILIKQGELANSQSSSRSSKIHSRLLKYFEDSLQKEIPVNMSPSAIQNENSNEI